MYEPRSSCKQISPAARARHPASSLPAAMF